MLNMPLVSVYIPTRNRAQQLRVAIESVQRQTHNNLEILVVDDGSTDDTPAMMKSMAEADSRITFFRNESSQGACVARNKAILASRGDFVTGLDDDDEFTPMHLKNLVSYWHLLTDASVQTSCLFVQYQCKDKNITYESTKRGSVTASSLLEANYVGNQIFAPRSHFIEAGLFDESMPAWQDLEFFYRVLQKFGTARLLDIPSYIFDVSPRLDRVSSQQKHRILLAYELMFSKHGQGVARTKQKLLMQVHSSYYGFGVSLREFMGFCLQGFWPRGYTMMFFRLLGRNIEL